MARPTLLAITASLLLPIVCSNLVLGQDGHVLIDEDTFWLEDVYVLDSLTIDGARLTVGGGSLLEIAGELRLTNGGELLLQGKNVDAQVDESWQGISSTVRADRVTIENGTAISADGQGYVGTAGPGAGASDAACSGGTAGGGASHGGKGAASRSSSSPGERYGIQLTPLELGSGGGNNPGCDFTSTASAGGGAIVLEVGGVLQLDGRISADAATVDMARLGGGAGGSVYVTATTLTGGGSFLARGAAALGSAGSGGGGRIAVYYEQSPAFSGFVASSTAGGDGEQPGEPGTVAFVETTTPLHRLYVYQFVDFDEDTTLELDGLTVANGGILRIGGGSTVNVTDDVLVSEQSTLVLGGKNRTAPDDGFWQGSGVTVEAEDVRVEAGSAISATGQGYIGTAGPGVGDSEASCGGSAAGAGAGHGGRGGNSQLGATGGTAYGSPVTPTELGSGGGNNPGCNVTSTVNAGGGAIVLNVRNVLQLDGAIVADGAGDLPARLGGGSGGSIHVDTATLTGSGAFSANGADGGNSASGGGAGGRIAVYYDSAPFFLGFTASTASGGSGFHSGEPGSIAFFDTSTPLPNLNVYQDLAFVPDSDLSYESITLVDGAMLRVGGGSSIDVSDSLTVTGGSTLLLESKNRDARVDGQWQGAGVSIEAGDVIIANGATISASGQGYVGGAGPGSGANDQNCSGSTAGAGGGYGGTGGSGGFDAQGGGEYGSPVSPVDLGSGGGNNPGCNFLSTQNAGGGVVSLNVRGMLQLDGVITADGAPGLSERLGGGSGGTIRVNAGMLTGMGFFSANGATGGSGYAGGGGGGRVAVYYDQATAFLGFSTSRADGGTGFEAGEPGSVAFFDTSTDPPRLSVYAQIGFPADSDLAYSSVTLDDVAIMRVGGGSNLSVAGPLVLRDNSTLLLEGKNRSALVAGEWKGAGVSVMADDVTVEQGSTISARGEGYAGTAGPGAGESDSNCGGSTAGGGAGHGGVGGAGQFGAAGGVTYGDELVPIDLGSGGGNNPGCNVVSTANAGGGAVSINVARALRLDGRIDVSAATNPTERLGGGAGGSIYVATATLAGDGTFHADGAEGGSSTAGGGGGGRIAVYSSAAATFQGTTASTAVGGNGFEAGEPGNVTFTDTTCDGDCSGDDQVTVDELIRAVNIALGNAPLTQCPAADSSGEGRITVDDLIRAVIRALSGC